MAAEELLVGTDYRQPSVERGEHIIACWFGATHHFDDQVGLLDDLHRVAFAARQHTTDLRPAAGQTSDLVGPRSDQLSER